MAPNYSHATAADCLGVPGWDGGTPHVLLLGSGPPPRYHPPKRAMMPRGKHVEPVVLQLRRPLRRADHPHPVAIDGELRDAAAAPPGAARRVADLAQGRVGARPVPDHYRDAGRHA